jgi:hypothetical protein
MEGVERPIANSLASGAMSRATTSFRIDATTLKSDSNGPCGKMKERRSRNMQLDESKSDTGPKPQRDRQEDGSNIDGAPDLESIRTLENDIEGH